MSIRKFTPGPWKYSYGWIVAPCDIAIAKAHCGAKGPLRVADMEANAHLIAAAPEMYDMLSCILIEQESHGEHGDATLKTAIAALLRKADGNTE